VFVKRRVSNVAENAPVHLHVVSLVFLFSRFYFRNWHGLNEKEPTVSRYALRSGTSQGISPLFEIKSLEYLFFQVCV